MKALVLAGGSYPKKELYDKMVSMVGGINKAKFAILTVTSTDYEFALDDGTFYVNRFNEWGMKSVWVNITHENKNSREIARLLSECNIYMFTGGVQFRQRIGMLQNDIVNGRFQDSLALRTIRSRVNSGRAIIGGTSAGTMIQQGRGMLCGGESYEAIVNPVLDVNDFKEQLDNDIWYDFNNSLLNDKYGGYGFFTNGILDTHFVFRGRQGRLIQNLIVNNRRLGFGIDNTTALVIRESLFESSFECFGENSVSVFSVENSELISQSPFHIRNVLYSRMTNGDVYYRNLSRFNFRNKQPYTPTKNTPSIIGRDVFSCKDNLDEFGKRLNHSQFEQIALQLIQSANQVKARGFSFERNPTVYVEFVKTPKTKAYIDEDGRISFEGMSISIMELKQ